MKRKFNFLLILSLLLVLSSQLVYANGLFAANHLSSGWISSALLIGGFVFLLISFFMPGMGLPEILSLVCFGLFFWAKISAGNYSSMGMVFSALGIIMLIIEVFVPGFSLPGILGIIFLGLGVYNLSGSTEEALLNIFLILLISVGFILYMFTRGFKSERFEKITLNRKIDKTAGPSQRYQKDVGVIEVGNLATSTTPLRPTGFIDYEGRKLDATAESDFIERNRKVIVTEIIGNKIIVKEVD